jgi:hypothetical protein
MPTRWLLRFPSPLWGGVRGGGSQLRYMRRGNLLTALPPSPTLPQRKSGLPDLRRMMRNPGRPGFRGGGGGETSAGVDT